MTRPLSILVLALLVGASCVSAQNEYVLDKIVAVVDGKIILKSEVDALVMGVAQQQGMAPTDALWNDALSELIDQKVLLVHAQRDTTMNVAQEQVQAEIDQRIARLAQQAGSESKLEELYGKTVAEIKAELTVPVREQLMASEFQRRRLMNVSVTPSEVREWFNKIPTDSLPSIPEVVRVAHVAKLPTVDPAAREDAMAVITALRDSVANGKATIEALSVFSDDPSAPSNQGRYESTPIRDLVSEFGAVAGQLDPDELSQVFETQFGLHFMRLHKRTGDIVDFSHILIRIDNSKVDPATAIDQLTLIRDSVTTMDLPFELAAKRHSDEPRSASRGGYVSDPATGERDLVLEALGPFWQQTVGRMEVGDISEPEEFQLLDGRRAWHIVLLQRRVPEHRVAIETDYARIEQFVLQEKRQTVRDRWVSQLRRNVHIEMRVDVDSNLASQ